MRRSLAALLAAGLLAPAAVAAAPATEAIETTTLLVLFAEGGSPVERTLLHERAGAEVTGSIPELGLVRVVLPSASAALYRTSPLVRAVEAPRTLHIASAKPNDPLLKLQWPLRRLEAFRAWPMVRSKGSEVLVAVIDTGVDAGHSDLEERVVGGFDFLELDENTYDDNGHGTHVSGIIAANAGNGKGVAGLSPVATIIPMKSCTGRGACPVFETYLGAVDAVRRGAAVLNMSLGGAGECTTIDQTVYDWVRGQGTLTVVAAGNAAKDGNPSITPANCDNTLAVGATDQRDRRAVFSGFGDFVDIAAPGVDVWSTLPPLVSILSAHIGYGPASGTSMATPYVAAAASLVKARHPDWTPAQIEEKLLRTATDAGKKGRDDHFGAGILDLIAALR